MPDRREATDTPMVSLDAFDAPFELPREWPPKDEVLRESPAAADEAVALEHTAAEQARNTLVEWMLGNRCTFACSYCPPELHDGSLPWISADVILPFLEEVRRHYSERLGRRVWIQYTGGEPTVHPDFARILAAGHAAGFRQCLISNASRTLRFWSDIVGAFDFAILTYHSEFAEFDHFLAVARLVSENHPLHINVTMIPERFDDCLAAASRLHAALGDISIALKPLRKGFGSELYPYDDEQKETMRRGLPARREPGAVLPRTTMTLRGRQGSARVVHANRLILDGLNHWQGWRCMAGLESLRIKPDGSVYRSVCGVGGRLGRVGEPIAFPTTAVTCDRSACACISDILISKRRRAGDRERDAIFARGAIPATQEVGGT
jgi:organic radical activating enzyme